MSKKRRIFGKKKKGIDITMNEEASDAIVIAVMFICMCVATIYDSW